MASRQSLIWARNILYLLSVLLFVLLGYFIGFYLIAGEFPGFPGAGFAIRLLAVIVGIQLIVLIHEAGHAAAAKYQGWQFLYMVAGLVRFENLQGKLRFSLNTDKYLFAGKSAFLPSETSDLRKQMIVHLAGGPAASFVAGVILVVIFLVGFVYTSPAGLLLATTGYGSLAAGFISLVPFSRNGVRSDGAQLIEHLFEPEKSEIRIASMKINLESISGKLPDELDRHALEMLNHPNAGPAQKAIYRHILAKIAMSKSELERAEEYLKENVFGSDRKIPQMIYQVSLSELVFLKAFLQKRKQEAGRLYSLADFSTFTADRGTRYRAEAALALSRGRKKRAGALIDQAERDLQRYFDKGSARWQLQWIEEMRKALERSEKPDSGEKEAG